MQDNLVPLTLVLAAGLLVPRWSREATLTTTLVTLATLVVLIRYFVWRMTETVLPAIGSPAEVGFVWIVFLAELWLWYESLVLCAILLRRTDRSGEADAHEARLRAMRAEDLPAVDVLIATYNEPLDVLERTIAGARGLDWPASRLNIYILDDGRRDWLAEYCRDRNVIHMTRPDNAHAKAGNINAAIPRTTSPFLLVLDADFVPQRQMLMRAIGFFEDPHVGIVQMPHHFFNSTPLQTNMDMRLALPDEQRFFFDVIQPGRDGWNCAFCCGSNGILRRSALEKIGGALPTDSITEDMLLTLALLRRGYVTRYLGERLAVGLAPETMDAYFVQRERWARGAIQMLYTPHGPLGPGLNFSQRVLFNPSHWLSQSICQPLAMATPAIYLLTGAPPLVGADIASIVSYQLPAIATAIAYLGFLAPRDFAPVASTVESVLQSFRLMPSILWTLVKPHGHAFRVTPKGSGAAAGRVDRFTLTVCITLILATGTGLLINTDFNTRLVADVALLPMVAFWSVFNMIVLLIVMTAVVPRPAHRSEERFPLMLPSRLEGPSGTWTAETRNVSLSGARIELHPDSVQPAPGAGDWLFIDIAGIGRLAGQIRRSAKVGDVHQIGLAFVPPSGCIRDRLLRALYAEGLDGGSPPTVGFGLVPMLLLRAFAAKDTAETANLHNAPKAEPPPPWIEDALREPPTRETGETVSAG